MSVDSVTVYLTASNAIRKTADDCRRITALFDALRVKYEKVLVDTKEMLTMIGELSGEKKLPQSFVGKQFLGTYDSVFALNEKGNLPAELRRLGYAGDVVGGENIPVTKGETQVVKKTVRKVVKKKKPKKNPDEESDPDAPPPPPEDSDDGEDEESDAPPPPPDSDGEAQDDLPPDPPGEEPPEPPPDDE
jgi:glutaredoxin